MQKKKKLSDSLQELQVLLKHFICINISCFHYQTNDIHVMIFFRSLLVRHGLAARRRAVKIFGRVEKIGESESCDVVDFGDSFLAYLSMLDTALGAKVLARIAKQNKS